MKKMIFSLLTLALILALIPAGMAKKPAPKLACTMDYVWMPGWEGTISGDIEGVIQWWMGGPSGPMLPTGQASHYKDRFTIWNVGKTELLLVGDEAGTTTARHGKNSNWRTNGTIIEASAEYEDWIGRKNHTEGHFTWVIPGLPDNGVGTFRIN